jgi:RHS repeat-associated protein
VLAATDGSLYICDAGNHRIRQVLPNGMITTAAGTTMGFSGDGGPAAAAQLNYPEGLSFSQDGKIMIVDSNHRIREVWYPQEDFLEEVLIASADGGSVFVFSPGGRHLSTLHALTGEVLYTFAYDIEGRLVNVTDAFNNITTVERDAAGNPSAIVAPHGQRTNLGLDTNGYLASITNPAGENHSFTYHGDNGLLATHTDPRNNTSEFTYDALGRLILDEDPEGGYMALTRTEDSDGYEVEMSTAKGVTSTYRVERDPSGEVRMENDLCCGGGSTVTQIDPDGSLTIIMSDGTVITDEYGPDPRWGMQVPMIISRTITTPGALTKLSTYNRTTVLTDPFDPFSLETQTDAISVNGKTQISIYDASLRRFTDTSADGRERRITLNPHGLVTKIEPAGWNPFYFNYNGGGLLSGFSRGSGADLRETTISYNSDGNVENISDPLSQITTFEYDSAGRIIGKTLPDSSNILAAYDDNGNLSSITPAGRPSHDFSNTTINLLEQYTPPDVGIGNTSTLIEYDLDRNIETETRPDGKTVNLGYDAGGRLETITIARGQYLLAYDAISGRLTGITAPGSETLSYTYDGYFPLGSTWTGTISGSVTRTFNNDFQVATESVNAAHTIAFVYDNDLLLVQAGELVLTRDSGHGLVTGTTIGNVADTTTYDSFSKPDHYNASYDGSNIFDVQYTYDKLDRITQMIETIGGSSTTTQYEYDPAGRLKKIWSDSILSAEYTYDDNGNRLSYADTGGTINGTYDNQDRLLQYGGATYGYTANGELLTNTVGGQTTTYGYDELGNLIGVTLPDSTQIEYIVDGQNRRIGKKVGGVLVQGFLYSDQINPVAELDGAGSVVSRFVYGIKGNIPEYMEKNGSRYRIVSDHLDNPRLVVKIDDGTVAQRMDFDEFGNVLLDTNPGFQPFGFAGGLYDSNTGLIRFGARDYDAETGRWMSKDPILFAGGSMNLYTYVGNDPVNHTDPSGLLGPVLPWLAEQIIKKAGEEIVNEIAKEASEDTQAEELFHPGTAAERGGKEEQAWLNCRQSCFEMRNIDIVCRPFIWKELDQHVWNCLEYCDYKAGYGPWL